MAQQRQSSTILFDPADEYRPEPAPEIQPPAWQDGRIRIGIHTSIAGNVSRALDTAHGLGANALQIFSASPRMWDRGASRIAATDAERFRTRRTELRLGPLAIHANYLINLASPSPVLRTRSVQAFHQEIVRGVLLGAEFLVIHPGCAVDGRKDAAIAAIAQGLKQAARGLKFGDLKILLENTAGQGSSIGSRFDELKTILDACPELPLGVCIDTAHLFASGWDIRAVEGLDRALDAIHAAVGLERVHMLHMNDSKTPLGSRVDRHEHIGKGKIGLGAFGRILQHPRLVGKAFILETPIDKPGDDRRNVQLLWKLASAKPAAVRAGTPAKRTVTRTRVRIAKRAQA